MWPGIWNILDGWFFGEAARGKRPFARALRLGGYPYAVIRDLIRGEMSLRAMGLVYATLLSTIPLLAFVFALLKSVGAHRDLKPFVFDFFRPIGPNAAQVTNEVMGFAAGVSGGLVGAVGFALLLWTLLGTLTKVEASFNFVWHVERPRSLPRRVAAYTALLLIAPVMLVALIALSKSALASPGVQYVARLPLGSRLLESGLALSPYVTVTAVFTILYLIVPNTSVRLRPALLGALAAGVAWAALGGAFTTLFVASARLMIVYAGFAIVVEALLWTYFGWLILLAGAQLAFYIQNPNYLRLGFAELRLSSIEQERLAIEVMYLIGRTRRGGGPVWTPDALTHALGLPGIAVERVVRALEDARLLAAGKGGALEPARDLEGISVRAILEAARHMRSGDAPRRALELPAVDGLVKRLEECWQRCCAERSLRDLIEEAVREEPVREEPA
jgi:membrane protein